MPANAHKRFALALLPLAASLFFSPLAQAQNTAPAAAQAPPPPATLDASTLPTAMLLYRCDTPPTQTIGEVQPRDPGDGVTAHVPLPLASGWCVRVLTTDEREIAEACVGALQPVDALP